MISRQSDDISKRAICHPRYGSPAAIAIEAAAPLARLPAFRLPVSGYLTDSPIICHREMIIRNRGMKK